MTIKEFLAKTQISIPDNVNRACEDGMNLMTQSIDPIHNHKHPERMLDDLALMIHNAKEIDWKKVNFSILLLSVIWHDVWKGRRIPKSKRKLVYYQLAEGLGSMRLFGKESKKYNLDRHLINKVKYAIRKHSSFQILPKRTLESELLKLLDELEDWSPQRVWDAVSSANSFLDFSPRLASIFHLFVNHWLRRKTGKKSKFPWFNREYQRRKAIYFETVWPGLRESLNTLRSRQTAKPGFLAQIIRNPFSRKS